MARKMVKVLHLIKTKSYDSDGRLLKWIESLKEYGIGSDVFILADDNKPKSVVVGQTKIIYTNLFSRKLFGKSKGLFFKVPEFTVRSIHFLIKSSNNICIFHDLQHYLSLFLFSAFKSFHKKKLIWDIHELPHPVIVKYWISRKMLKYIIRRIDFVIFTNRDRQRYMEKTFGNHNNLKAIINNYPSNDYIAARKANLPKDLAEWLNGYPYILWMGKATERRNFVSVLEAFAHLTSKLRLVIMGSVTPDVFQRIKEKELEEFIYVKYVKQEEILNYVDNALYSIVFYKHISPNNYYCEPNRLYQLITRNVPVIVGSNPPMVEIVQKYRAGIILQSDGSDIDEVQKAMTRLYDKNTINTFKANLSAADFQQELSWERQFASVVPQLKALNL